MRQTVYKNYLLTVLLIILAFNNVDRLALGMLMQDIKADLSLSDTELGLLTGIAFAMFYSVMGIPIARWADRGNRITIISLTTALWSAGVVLCGMATSFVQLLLIRMGVAVGEAGCNPPALSLIADHFSRAERPRAVARYMLGLPLALIVGYLASGWLNELYGWRTTFVLLGVPGLLLAAIVSLTLKEPRRSWSAAAQTAHLTAARPAAQVGEPHLYDVLRSLWTNGAFRHLLFCFSVWCFFGYGILQWQPAFFVRSYGFNTGELGTWFAAVYGLGGLLGTHFGGELASRYAANNEQLQLGVIAVQFAIFALILAGAYLASDRYLAFGLLAISSLGGAAINGPLFAAVQTLVPPRMRATSIALMFLFSNLIGMGLGPLAVGALSDALRPAVGDESLRYALIASCPGYLWAAWHAWRASREVRIAAAAQAQAASSTESAGIAVAE